MPRQTCVVTVEDWLVVAVDAIDVVALLVAVVAVCVGVVVIELDCVDVPLLVAVELAVVLMHALAS